MMTQKELNNYILHYLTADKTKSAIMLTGAWGTGKSHYIQNNLIPFLIKDENGAHQCITVSLYGLKDTFEISRAIYLECRAKFLRITSEGAATGRMVGKTIFKGVTSFFGVDLSKTEQEMQEVYESINLSGKLIIIEDLERSGISILDVLGYVNNLVEQDGVKVLLVANEQEILDTELKTAKDKKGNDITIRVNTPRTEEYLRTKEKTVSDTISFVEDFNTAIQEIINMFENDTLYKFSTPETAKDIVDIMYGCGSLNLRSFIFACQKVSDIFDRIEAQYTTDDEFVQAIFFGILFYVLRKKNGAELRWGKEKVFSEELGYRKFPLFKFCYDYLERQILDLSSVRDAFEALKKLNLYDKNKSNTDEDINVICNYHIHSEKDVLKALSNIENRLKNQPEDISFYMYGTIAVYSIIIKEVLNCDIDSIKTYLIENLRGKGNELQIDYIFRTLLGENSSEISQREYKELRKKMEEALNSEVEIIPYFDYLPEQAGQLYNFVVTNEIRFHSRGGFLCDLDIERIAEMFYMSSPEQKEDIRGTFLAVYRPSNIKALLPLDFEYARLLHELIKEQAKKDVGDKIHKLQYLWFSENLEEICQKLS